MATLMQASREWSRRPNDERYTSLTDLHDFVAHSRARSKAVTVSSRRLEARPVIGDEMHGIEIHGPNGVGYKPTHFSFGQLATLGGAPGGYLRTLPAPIACDALNYGLQFARDIEDVGVLLRKPNGEEGQLAAATGPKYGRIWNDEVTGALVERFGDGRTGDWRIPGEFGVQVPITKANTTLYASDRDMFVFLADEQNRVEMPNRRNGRAGSLSRGFFAWNSEVGSSTFGVGFFLFDYACSNRIVWGAEGYTEIRLRHTAGAPDRWLEEAAPALLAYKESAASPIETVLKAAQAAKVDNLADFLKNRRFAANMAGKVSDAFENAEGRTIESLWDVTTGLTEYAKTIPFQDERVALEREAGKILDLVAN